MESRSLWFCNYQYHAGEIRQAGLHKPEAGKICGRWCVDRNAVYVGPGAVGVTPEIHDDDDDALKEILNHVAKATKK